MASQKFLSLVDLSSNKIFFSLTMLRLERARVSSWEPQISLKGGTRKIIKAGCQLDKNSGREITMPQFYHHCPEKTPTLNESPHRGRFVVPPVGERVLGDGEEPRHEVDVRGRAVGSLKLKSGTDETSNLSNPTNEYLEDNGGEQRDSQSINSWSVCREIKLNHFSSGIWWIVILIERSL